MGGLVHANMPFDAAERRIFIMAEVRLTAEGVAKYEQRLEYLKTTARTEIAEQIKTARAFGDLSENAEYDTEEISDADTGARGARP